MNEFIKEYSKNNYLIFIIILIVIFSIQYFIFFNHYLNDFAFPWDFLETYYAVPYYWIEMIRNNIDTSWIPSQGMGYPLYMNLQSGYYYPFNWFFVIFDIPYTIHRAVILNIFHIISGSIGMIFVCKLLNLDWNKSLLGAILYLTFGSFYGNSGHIDIIRAYSFIPWIIGPFISSWDEKNKLLFISIALLPLAIYCLWTGGYIGVSVAIFFTLFTLLLIRSFFDRKNIRICFYIIVSCIIGFLLSSIFLLPSFLESKEFIRSQTNINYDYMELKDLFSLIYPIDNKSFSHDVTMRSMSVGLLGFSLYLIGGYKMNKINIKLTIILIISVLMATGFLHKYLILYLPQLGLSRFTFADYKALIGISIILIAVLSLEYVKRSSILNMLLFLLIIVLFGNYYLNLNFFESINIIYLFLSILLIVFSMFMYLHKKSIGIFLMIITCLFDFYRLHDKARYWNFNDATKYIESMHNISLINNKLLADKLNSTIREERIDEISHPYLYSGYFNGKYMMNDYGGSMHLKRYESIRNNSILKSYALLEWTPIIGNIGFIDSKSIDNKVNFVKLESYKTSEIRYLTSSSENTSFIENEIYWKGWKGKIIDEKGFVTNEILPENVDGFRKWNIPKGNYTLITSFTPQYQSLSLILSILGILFWLVFIYYIWRKCCDNKIRRI